MTARTEVRQRIRGLYGIADATASNDDPERMAGWLLEGGCRLVQLRCKDWDEDDFLRVARSVRQRCNKWDATFIVNDNPHITVAVAADGIHVGRLDLPTAHIRNIVGSSSIIGRSTNHPNHIPDTLVGVDYIAFGPIWTTPHISRPKPAQGLSALRQARAIVPEQVPLVAIGGIDLNRISELQKAGPDAWAVIGAVASAADPVAAVRSFVVDPARYLYKRS